MKRPAFQFYPGDWLRDPGVRALSFAAKGLWLDLLCLMFESDRKGYLTLNGKPPSLDQIARMTGGSTEEVSRLLSELETSGVFSRTEHGTIYSRRMVRDEVKREKCSEAGKRGGNPTLIRQSKGHPKGRPKGRLTPSSSTSVCCDADASLSPFKRDCAEAVSTSEPYGCESSVERREAANVGQMQAVLEEWNLVPGVRQARNLNASRKRALNARFRDQHWRESWREALGKVGQSAFCMGRNQRNWIATFDFFIKPDTVLKLLEGQYDGRSGVDFSGLEEFLSDDKA